MDFPRFPRRVSLPLLAKELIEQAARRRTYVVRIVYAALLQAFGLMMFAQVFSTSGGSAWGVLGRGSELFSFLTGMQFTGVYLFMPALVCGTVTQEKERDSLTLLFLTKLGPWTILLEKLLSRLIPMATLLLLCLPLQALAYSLGGVSPTMLWGSQWVLLVVMLQTSTLALACSCYFRTTVGAFIASYLVGFLMLFGPFVILIILSLILGEFNGPLDGLQPLLSVLRSIGIIQSEEQLLFPFFAGLQFFISTGGGAAGSYMRVLTTSIPSLLTCVVFIGVARFFLVRRAFAPAFNPLREAFRGIDRGLDRLRGGSKFLSRELIKDSNGLPEERPIAWREVEKSAFGRSRYLLRILLLILLPMIGLLCFGLAYSYEGCAVIAVIMTPVIWFIGVLMVAVKSVSLIAGERTHQTLDVLSTLPMTGREILVQKFRGVSRLIWILWAPLGLLSLIGALFRYSHAVDQIWAGGWGRPQAVPYFLISVLSAVVYLPLVAWLCCLIGMLVRNQGRAIITALAAIVGLCLFPFVLIMLPLEILFRGGATNELPWSWIPLLSPVTLPTLNEANEVLGLCGRRFNTYIAPQPGQPRYSEWEIFAWLIAVTLFNFSWYGAWWFGLRQICLANADRFLGRLETRQGSSSRGALPEWSRTTATSDPTVVAAAERAAGVAPTRPAADVCATELTNFLDESNE